MSQFMEVIEWFDHTGDHLSHRYPEEGSAEIKFGAQLVVRENQAAIFFRDGKGLDVLGPGRHTLSTQNLPILTKVLSLGLREFYLPAFRYRRLKNLNDVGKRLSGQPRSLSAHKGKVPDLHGCFYDQQDAVQLAQFMYVDMEIEQHRSIRSWAWPSRKAA